MSKKILSVARDLGLLVARARSTLPSLAQAVASYATKGLIDEDDANIIYRTYIEGTGIGKQPLGSSKANASKLRQIIKASLSNGRDRSDTPRMLEQVVVLHAKMRKRVNVKPLYEAMVLCCRKRAEQDRPLSMAQIEKLLRK